MGTLQRIQEFTLVAVMATGALIASATQADEGLTSEQANVTSMFADLGHITVLARRPAEVAHLGSMVVTAQRLSDTRVADLGDDGDRAARGGHAGRRPRWHHGDGHAHQHGDSCRAAFGSFLELIPLPRACRIAAGSFFLELPLSGATRSTAPSRRANSARAVSRDQPEDCRPCAPDSPWPE